MALTLSILINLSIKVEFNILHLYPLTSIVFVQPGIFNLVVILGHQNPNC